MQPLRHPTAAWYLRHHDPLVVFVVVVALLLQLASLANAGSVGLPRAAVLYDPNLVDLSDDGSGEAYNAYQTLSNWGYECIPIRTNAKAEWRAALDSVQVLVFPEPGEAGRPRASDPIEYLGLGVINQVRTFVAVGGLFVQLGDNLTVIPHVFGVGWTPGGSSQEPSVPTAARASSVFNDCAHSLAGLDLVYHYNASVNSSACLQFKARDADSSVGQCTLMRTTYGEGVVTWIGFDWYQARPVGVQDSGWLQVLRSALSEAPTPLPSPSPSSSPSGTPSSTPSVSVPPSLSTATASPSRSATPSRTPTRSATPSMSPAPATANYPDSDTALDFLSAGPNMRITEASSSSSAVLTFTQIALQDANGLAIDYILLPASDYAMTASNKSEVEMTGVETFSFASALSSAAMNLVFTHPIRNATMMSFAGQTFVVGRGAVKWLLSLDGAWPFDSRVDAFTLTTELELVGVQVTSVERINNIPSAGRTTYSVNGNSSGNGSTPANFEIKFIVFDHAVADGDLTRVAHAVELVTTPGGTQIAAFHFTFQRFTDAFAYDPEVVMVVHKIGGGGGNSIGGLIAGIVALLLIVGLVLVGIVRLAFLKAEPQDDGGIDEELVIMSTAADNGDHHHEEEEEAPPVLAGTSVDGPKGHEVI